MVATVSLPAIHHLPARGVFTTGWLRSLLAQRHARSELRRLLETSGHLLNDIGLGPDEVAAELAKPFWRR